MAAQVVEATSKSWKLIQLVGATVMLIGVSSCGIWGAYPEGERPDSLLATTVFGFLGGFAMIIVGRVGAWWNHG